MRFPFPPSGRHAVALAVATLLPLFSARAQTSLEPADYGQFERLGRGVLSPDGRVFAYTVSRVDGTSTLSVRLLSEETPPEDAETPLIEVDEGRDPTFSEDARWLAYSIGFSEDEREELTESKKPVRGKLGLLDLRAEDSSAEVIEDIASFAFSADGRFLALRGYPPEESASNDEDDEARDTGPRFTLVVRDLAQGHDTTFGNVTEYAWSDVGGILALIVRPDLEVGQGVQLFDPGTGLLRILDSGTAVYRELQWREDGYDLAVLRVHEEDGFEDETHHVLAWRGLEDGQAATLVCDQGDEEPFPEGMRIVEFRGLTWSDDGGQLFFGIKEWEREAEQEGEEDEKPDAGETETAGEDEEEDEEEEDAEPEPADVDVWHSADRRINPMQRKELERARRRNYLAVWNLDANAVLRLSEDDEDSFTLLKGQRFVIETDTDPHARDIMFGRDWHDYYRIDTRTGERTPILERVRYFLGGSATGRYVIYLKDDQLRTFDLEQGTDACLTCDVPSVFIDEEYDYPVEQKPAQGVAGWLEDDEAVLFYDEYDTWRAKPDGSECTRITRGAEREVVHRLRELDPEAEWIDAEGPLYYSLRGKWTKQSGFARGTATGDTQDLVLADRQLDRIARAKHADVFAFSSEAFDDSPDYSVCGFGFDDARAVTQTNAFRDDYAWGRSELIEYENAGGTRLQGALYYPAGFDAERQYPMIVYVYEKLSRGVRRFVTPSERGAYNTAVFTTQGYFVLQPDIVFQPREPGVSALDCVTAAVNAVLETGRVDPRRVGLVGHSWGGYEATYLPTRTDLFAASVAGAPLTNFLSFMGQIHWNQGMPELDHWETGQARMDVPFWEDFEAHVRNSPAAFVQDLNTPLLMTFGNADGVVDWHQGVEFYNFARRAGKFMVMLVYDGENHGLRKKHNQLDYHHRVLHWFDHFLKGAPAEPWITEGVPHLEREEAREKKDS